MEFLSLRIDDFYNLDRTREDAIRRNIDRIGSNTPVGSQHVNPSIV